MSDDSKTDLPILPDPLAHETILAQKAHILGVRGTIADIGLIRERLRALNGHEGVVAVLVRSDRILGELHVREAIRHAARLHRQDPAVQTSLAVDVLRFLGVCRQIEKALVRLGVTRGPIEGVLIVVGPIPVSTILLEIGLVGTDPRYGRPDDVLSALEVSAGARTPIDVILEAMALLELDLPHPSPERVVPVHASPGG